MKFLNSYIMIDFARYAAESEGKKGLLKNPETHLKFASGATYNNWLIRVCDICYHVPVVPVLLVEVGVVVAVVVVL